MLYWWVRPAEKSVPVSQLLRLNVGRIRGAHERIDRRFEPSVLGARDEIYRITEPVELGFDVDRDEDRFRLAGEVVSTIELTCSRCLEPFRMPVRATFDLHYLPQVQNAGEGELEVQEDDLATAFYEDEAIDLADLIREQLYLALPMKPLCDELCRGLCPTCGKDLNAGACGCTSDWDDPRLAPLKRLLKRD